MARFAGAGDAVEGAFAFTFVVVFAVASVAPHAGVFFGGGSGGEWLCGERFVEEEDGAGG